MQLRIIGVDPPGRVFCRPDGSLMRNIHVGVQVGTDPAQLLPADTPEPRWTVTVEVVQRDGRRDFRGPAVHGRRGDRFLYLTWGEVGAPGAFEMFRRAKLMLDRIDPALLEQAVAADSLEARVVLTDDAGAPRCARVDPPAIAWAVPPA